MSRGASRRWDLVVLGGGTAGIVAAKTAANLGARVALVERGRPGGDCLWTGCVPSKALLAAAEAAAVARGSAHLGVTAGDVQVDVGAAIAHAHAAIAHIEPIDTPEALERAGVHVVLGTGRFTSERTLDVDGRTLRFDHAVVATGAEPAVPPIPGLDAVPHLTSETVWDLEGHPGRLAVLGGGSIGSELGQAFARLGVPVTLVEGSPRLLPREDPAAAAAVHDALVADGADVRVGASVERIAAGRLHLEDGSAVAFDRLLVAVGRRPRTAGLGVEAAGVQCDERGFVVVDDTLRTTNPRIRAAGDLTGHPQFTHVAASHGSLAASNAILGVRRTVGAAVPRVTYTDPEVAAIGVDTGRPGDGIQVVERAHDDVDRAVAQARTEGVTRLAIDRRGRVLGATIVGPRAGESLGEVALAIQHGLRTRDLASLMHPYPTWNDAVANAALVDVRAQLARRPVRWALRVVLALRRRWLRGPWGRRG